jgi:hypothetical protein
LRENSPRLHAGSRPRPALQLHNNSPELGQVSGDVAFDISLLKAFRTTTYENTGDLAAFKLLLAGISLATNYRPLLEPLNLLVQLRMQ